MYYITKQIGKDLTLKEIALLFEKTNKDILISFRSPSQDNRDKINKLIVVGKYYTSEESKVLLVDVKNVSKVKEISNLYSEDYEDLTYFNSSEGYFLCSKGSAEIVDLISLPLNVQHKINELLIRRTSFMLVE